MSTPRWAERMVAFDTETTGVDPFDARMVSAAVVEFHDGIPVERYEWQIDPGVPIPPAATRIHGVHDDHREGRQDHAEALDEILGTLDDYMIDGFTLVVYNAAFDLTLVRELARDLLDEEWQPNGLVVDPMVIDRALDKFRKGRRHLAAQCEHYGVELDDAHDARADAEAAGYLAVKMGQKWSNVLSVPGAEMLSIQQTLAKQNDEGLRAWFVKTGRDPREVVSGWPMREIA